MGFSSILDISSFFIGMIINLIFVALMCYYFKRKYDYLEVAQNEQAKILYQLIHKSVTCPAPPMDFTRDPLVKPITSDIESDSENESGSDSGSDTESDNGEMEEIEVNTDVKKDVVTDAECSDVKMIDLELDNTVHLTVEEIQPQESMDISIQLVDTETNYSKMSMKQLKEVLSSKGIKAKTNIKKDELVELLTNDVRA
jgi:hypothetical protein